MITLAPDLMNSEKKKEFETKLKEYNTTQTYPVNDQIPEGHYGIENPNGGRPGGSAKINGISLNHRYIFGHDLFKPLEILKDLGKIPEVTPVLGSKKLGGIVKQFFHIFYDTFSGTGIPAPGSTYF
jgi:hypothetical protein